MARRRKNRNAMADVASALGVAGGAATHSAGGKGGKKGSVRNVGSALSSAASTAESVGTGRAQRRARHAATRVATSYSKGKRSVAPTVQNVKLAWPALNEKQRADLATRLIDHELSQQGPAKRLPKFLRKYAPEKYDALAGISVNTSPGKSAESQGNEALKELRVDTPGEAVDLGLTLLPGGAIARTAEGGLRALQLLRGAEKGAEAVRGAKLAKDASEAARAGTSARRGGGAISRLGSSRAVQSARSAASGAKGKVADTALGKGASAVGRGASRAAKTKPGRVAVGTTKFVATSPVHPFKKGAPLYLGVSAAGAAPAAVKEGSIAPVGQALSDAVTKGEGTARDVLDTIGNVTDNFGVVGNAAQDILELPAAAVPSTWLLGEGVVKAVGGDDSMLKEQLNDYIDHGFLSGLAKGDVDQAVTALKNHPVFSGLEVYGAGAVADRGIGMALPKKERPSLDLVGADGEIFRGYSKSAIARGLQRRADRKREARTGRTEDGKLKATPKETEKYLHGGTIRSGKADFLAGNIENSRRARRSRDLAATEGNLARQKVVKGRKSSKANRDGVAVVGEFGIPARGFREGLTKALRKIDADYAAMKAKRDKLSPGDERSHMDVKIKANREQRKQVQNVLDHGDPAEIYASLSEIAPHANRAERDLIENDPTLNADQAMRAKLFAPGQLHFGWKRGVPNDRLSADALSVLKSQRSKIDKEIASLQAKANKATDLDARNRFLTKMEELSAERARIDKEMEGGPAKDTYVDENGNYLTTKEMQRRLEEIGVDTENIIFLTQAPRARGRGSFYRGAWPDPNKTGSRARTGEATFGGHDVSAEALVEQVVRTGQKAEALRSFNHALQTSAPKTPTGGMRIFRTGERAKEAVADPAAYNLDPNIAWRAVRVNTHDAPFEQRLIEDAAGGPPDQLGAELELASAWERTKLVPHGEGNYTVIPESMAKRFDEHFHGADTTRKVMQVLSGAFKGTVLPYSPKWLVGNIVDVQMRMLIAGHPPIQRVTSMNRRFVNRLFDDLERELGPEAADWARTSNVPGTHMSSVNATKTVRKADQFIGTNIAPLAERLQLLREKPGPRQLVDLHERYKQWVFSTQEQLLEVAANEAQLGKLIRREAIEKGYIKRWQSVWNMESEARLDLAKGLLNTDKQMYYAKGVWRVLGQWSHNTPMMRRWLIDYAPFGMWTRAATSFVFKTMPVDHPILTGIISVTEQMTQQEREALGLTLFTSDPLPGNLRGGIPTPSGGLRGGVAGITSFGYFADPSTAVASTILPQFSGPIFALNGLDWTGDHLKNPDGSEASDTVKFLAAAGQGAETFLPFLSVLQRVNAAAGASDWKDAIGDLSLGKDVDEGLANYLREPKQSIQVPIGGSGSSYESPFSSGGGSSTPSFLDGYGSGSSSSSSTPSFLDSYR